MSIVRAFPFPVFVAVALAASVAGASAQGSGSSSGGSGSSSSGGAAGSSGGASVSSPSYSASTPRGTPASGGVGGGGDRAAGSAINAERKYPEGGGRTIRCPDGSIGKTDAGGCLGGPQ